MVWEEGAVLLWGQQQLPANQAPAPAAVAPGPAPPSPGSGPIPAPGAAILLPMVSMVKYYWSVNTFKVLFLLEVFRSLALSETLQGLVNSCSALMLV